MSMSKEKTADKSGHGGYREGAGRKARDGGTQKICVSVNQSNWQTALSKWAKKPSWLVDRLVLKFVNNEVAP